MEKWLLSGSVWTLACMYALLPRFFFPLFGDIYPSSIIPYVTHNELGHHDRKPWNEEGDSLDGGPVYSRTYTHIHTKGCSEVPFVCLFQIPPPRNRDNRPRHTEADAGIKPADQAA